MGVGVEILRNGAYQNKRYPRTMHARNVQGDQGEYVGISNEKLLQRGID